MFRMGRLRFLAAVIAASAAALAVTPAADAAGPIQSGLATPVAVTTLKPGVTLTQYRVTVADAGVLRTQSIYKVSWTIGNSHLSLDSAVLGTYYADDHSVRLTQIRGSAATTSAQSSLAAAINGDFFADSSAHSGAGRPSGLLVHDRTIYAFGWGGPAVGYMPGGNMAMGRPQAVPSLITLPNGKTASVGAFNALSSHGVAIHGDQVAAYVNAGARLSVPAGYVGFVLPSTVLRTMLRGSRGGFRYSTGSNVSETVAGFRFEDPAAAYQQSSVPTSKPSACPTGTCAAGTQLTVPVTGVVVLARAGGIAATGLSAKSAAGGVLSVANDNVGWDAVDDVMGGKPQLVNNGIAITTRPSFVDPWQWDNPHWRPAVVKANNGQGWLVVAGGNRGVGIQGTTWAKMLVQMGAQSAMGFDNNSSTELYRPGVSPITAYGYERSIPSATFLSYH
ncbi:MAG: Phosphodiester glycosidase [Gaiellales bacterium]|nr:Phosphodiester glycosidase [Gaiellales bacterium]